MQNTVPIIFMVHSVNIKTKLFTPPNFILTCTLNTMYSVTCNITDLVLSPPFPWSKEHLGYFIQIFISTSIADYLSNQGGQVNNTDQVIRTR